jgi:hypothetical protein
MCSGQPQIAVREHEVLESLADAVATLQKGREGRLEARLHGVREVLTEKPFDGHHPARSKRFHDSIKRVRGVQRRRVDGKGQPCKVSPLIARVNPERLTQRRE